MRAHVNPMWQTFFCVLVAAPLAISTFIILFAPSTVARAWHWILDSVAVLIIGYGVYEVHRRRRNKSRHGTPNKAP